MKLYVTPEGRWAGTQADAKQLAKTDASYETIEVPVDKPGLLAWLNRRRVGSVAAHDAAVRHALDLPTPTPAPARAPVVSYTATSIGLDEAWEALPLARKLHFAALALEDARELLKVEA